MRGTRGAWALAATLAAGLLLSGCGDDAAPAEADAAPAAGGPVSLERCGEQIELPAPASRAVTLNQHATELVLAMGLGDRLIGSSLLDNDVNPDLLTAYEKVPVLSELAYPSKEALIGLGPDVLIGGFGPTFSEANNLQPDQFRSAGIGLFTVQCRDQQLDLAALTDVVTRLGVLFGDPAAATTLNAQLDTEFQEVREQVAGNPPVDTLVFDSGEAAPTVGGGQGIGDELLTLAGGKNVFADLDDDWGEASWEEVVARDPDVIVIVDYRTAGITAEKKISDLKANPALAGVTAVRDDRFVVVGLTGFGALSPSNPDVAAQLADTLHPNS
ncbi:ABC transporter substrate-binding protein [Parafrankia sp. FMc2]|uniref:ABC transporter substrate-binding protein n=1 Tax=Parafrankia sp. FMc2 TaxID=3233196 RepID=UPI0034D5798E